jgi:ABC-type antimicrobial peptide transport system permease subunit
MRTFLRKLAWLWQRRRRDADLAIVGLAIGSSTALATSRFVAAFLYGLTPNDPLALTLAVLIFVGAALLAGYVPARKAARIDPMTAVRHE